MKKSLLIAGMLLLGGIAGAQNLNDITLAMNTVQDSAHFYYYINFYPQLGQWDIKKHRAKEYGSFSEYTLEGKFDRIWLLSPHDAIVKKKGKYSLFNLDTKKFTTKYDYEDVRFAWGGQETGPIALYTKTKDYEGWDLYHLVEVEGKRMVEKMEVAPSDSFYFVARNCVKLFKDGKESLINEKGETIVPFEYAHVGVYRIYDEGKTTIVDVQGEDGKYGVIRIRWDGTVTELAPCEYDSVDIGKWPCFIERGGKYAIIYNKDGSQTDLVYDTVEWFPQGMIVSTDGKFGFQKWGRIRIPLEYDSMEMIKSTETSNKKALKAMKGETEMIFNTNGELIYENDTQEN